MFIVDKCSQNLFRRAAGGNRRCAWCWRLGGLIWSYTLSGKLTTQQTELADAKQQNVKLEAELRETDARLKVATDELGKSLGLTQKQMDTAPRRFAASRPTRPTRQQLATAQKQTAQQVSAVSSA
jgi:hypothetical protein